MAYGDNSGNFDLPDPSELVDDLEPEVVEVGPGIPIVKPKGAPGPDGMGR